MDKNKESTRLTDKQEKNKGGRPPIYSADKIADDLLKYLENTDDPMVEEFCLIKGNPTRDTIYRLEKENDRLSDTIKKVHAKQQIRTVKLVEAGAMNPTWAIFKMKQRVYGWTDKQEIEQLNVNVEAELSESEADEIIKRLTRK